MLPPLCKLRVVNDLGQESPFLPTGGSRGSSRRIPKFYFKKYEERERDYA